MRGSTLLAFLAAMAILSVVAMIALVVVLAGIWLRADAKESVAQIDQVHAYPAIVGNDSSTGGWHANDFAEPASGTTCVTVAPEAFNRR